MRTRSMIAAFLALIAVAAIAWWGLRAPHRAAIATASPTPTPAVTRVAVPLVHDAIKLDGELDESAWHVPGRTGPFRFEGSSEQARPYSDARAIRDDENLYLALYAADQDQRRGTDKFRVAFVDARDGSILTMTISVDKVIEQKQIAPDGTESAWDSGVRVGVDSDGTLDESSDEDEEWIVEAAIPLASLGVTPGTREIKASFARCDVPKGAPEACGDWGVGADGGVAGVLAF